MLFKLLCVDGLDGLDVKISLQACPMVRMIKIKSKAKQEL